jgi:hypothetical protein
MARWALLALALALVPAAAASGQQIQPTFQLDRKKDVRGPLDIVRVAMSTREDGTLRGELTMRRRWQTADVGTRGSLCLKLYVKAEPGAQAPEYLVCATPSKTADGLDGKVMRNRSNGLPRDLGDAAIARPTRRTIFFSFDPALIRSPQKLRFAGETVWRGDKCPRAAGCADLAPDGPGARDFHLRSGKSSG